MVQYSTAGLIKPGIQALTLNLGGLGRLDPPNGSHCLRTPRARGAGFVEMTMTMGKEAALMHQRGSTRVREPSCCRLQTLAFPSSPGQATQGLPLQLPSAGVPGGSSG